MAKKTKTLGKLKQEVQVVFNAYIRERDNDQPCISCGQYKTLQAGHFYAVSTHQGLRYDEYNVHGECSGCNCFNESHLINYYDNLIRKIGTLKFMELQNRAAEYKANGYKFTRSELMEIKNKYQTKLNEL